METKLNPNILEDWLKIACKNKRIYYVTNHVSRTGMGASYNLYVIHSGDLYRAWPNAREAESCGYSEKLAKAVGFRNTQKMQAFYRGGCGYDRVHDILYTLASHFAGDDAEKRKNALQSISGISRDGL